MRDTKKNWDPNTAFHALALTGGGYRGLFTARVLECIEAEIQEPIGRRFDLITGTSIGGLIALAIAFEVPMEKVVRVFRERGPLIFPKCRRAPQGPVSEFFDMLAHLLVPRYHTNPLKDAINELIPTETLLAEVKHAVAIPAVNVTKGTLRIMKTPHDENFLEDAKRSIGEIALATSAAPTFFDLAESKGDFFADGGLFANAPDLVAAHEAEHFFKVPSSRFKLLSIGTLSSEFSIPKIKNRSFGIKNWVKDGRLIELIISAQEQFAKQIMEHRFDRNYVRLDKKIDRTVRPLPLDDSSVEMTTYLIECANEVADEALKNGITNFIKHKPTIWKNNG